MTDTPNKIEGTGVTQEAVKAALEDWRTGEGKPPKLRLRDMLPDLAIAYLEQAQEIERLQGEVASLRKRVSAADRLGRGEGQMLAWGERPRGLQSALTAYRKTVEGGK